MSLLRNLFGRKKTKNLVLPSDTARKQPDIGIFDGLAKSIVDEIATTSGMDDASRNAQRLFKSIAEEDSMASKTDSARLVPGDIVVSLTDARTVALGVGGLFQQTEDDNTVYLDVMVLSRPGSGVTSLSAKGPDGYQSSLEGLIKDQQQLYVLRIERDNLDYLKQNPQIWKRVKKVIGG